MMQLFLNETTHHYQPLPICLRLTSPNYAFLHKIRYAKLFEAIVKLTKIHVQIMRFTCCWTWVLICQYLKWALIYLSGATRKSVAALTDHYVDVFVRENIARIMTLWRRYDVRKFNADAILFGEKHCKKKGILMLSGVFCGFLVGIR